MFSLSLEPTNTCNRSCLHCIRDKKEPRESISLDLVDKILREARALKIDKIKLTGGEITTYPDLEQLISMIVDYGFRFNFVTNGNQFQERLLPLLTQNRIKKKVEEICFSLDGAKAESHYALRGKGSFKEVMKVATLCKVKDIPINLKSIITEFNKRELTDLALLGATLGAQTHNFIFPIPTPELIQKQIIPSPAEAEQIILWIMNSLTRTIKTSISVDAYCVPTVVFWCCSFHNPTVDYQGNLVFCCTLSHVVDEGKPATFGKEFLVDLRENSLSEGISRHFDVLAELMKKRLEDAQNLSPLTYIPCYWCFKHFGKLEWLRNHPESPWAAGILENDRKNSI
jgi:MoaA/NifB/PqqE/SkfB family radical SAM enzyme